ncbi:MAG: hypothetical protein H6899_05320 [Rhodobacter sp.]|nr:hypothetical protein [Rhodobacter sp.]
MNLVVDDRGNQIPADDEENVNADEPAGENLKAGVEKNHRHNRDSTQAIYLWTILQRLPDSKKAQLSRVVTARYRLGPRQTTVDMTILEFDCLPAPDPVNRKTRAPDPSGSCTAPGNAGPGRD